MSNNPKNNLPYDEALHGMQAGVALELERDPTGGTPKHLRVGVNSAMINDAALVDLLVDKGVITRDEFAAALRKWANLELDLYEARIAKLYGAKVTLR